MELLAKIRRWHLRDKVPIREIARRTSLSKNTIKKYLRNETLEPAYPARSVTSRKIDPYTSQLAVWLKADAGKPRKERRDARALYEALKLQGFAGDYSRVTAFIRTWREDQGKARRDVYVPLAFAAGEAMQFDWSVETAELGGQVVRLKVAQAKLCHSRLTLRVAYFSEHVLNVLARLKEPKPPEQVDAPQDLALSEEPKADVSRYDTLRMVMPLAPLLPALQVLAEVRHAA